MQIISEILVLITAIFLAVFMYGNYYLAGKKYSGKKTVYFWDGRFHVPKLVGNDKKLADLFRWIAGENNSRKWTEAYGTSTQSYVPLHSDLTTKATFINHSTVLIENSKISIITDPVFTKRASPFTFLGPKRHHEPYIAVQDIPKLDVVLISHNHYDHLSIESLVLLETMFSPVYIVPLNNGQFIERAGVPKERIIELNIFETCTVKDTVFTLEKAQHWSSRFIFDKDRYLWGSYMIETNNRKIFFAGDSGYNSHFKEIGENYQGIDLALIPIGAYEPRWFMKTQHMNPEEAVRVAFDLNAGAAMGIHFGTFKLTDEGRHDPEQATSQALVTHRFTNQFLVPTMTNGISIEI